MRLSLRHATTYRFDPPVRGVTQSLRLWPSEFEGQRVERWQVRVDGVPVEWSLIDGAGDRVGLVHVRGAVDSVEVVTEGVVETQDLSGVLRGHRERAAPLTYLTATRQTRADAALKALAEEAVAGCPGDGTLAQAHALMNAVRDAIDYTPGETEERTTAAEALSMGHGVCQDHAHALIGAAVSRGIPARYVSGYLRVHAEEGAAEASHAWAELWIDDLGWVGFDASNRACPDENYVRIGSGSDSTEAAPIRGVAQGGGTETMEIDLSIEQAQQ